MKIRNNTNGTIWVDECVSADASGTPIISALMEKEERLFAGSLREVYRIYSSKGVCVIQNYFGRIRQNWGLGNLKLTIEEVPLPHKQIAVISLEEN